MARRTRFLAQSGISYVGAAGPLLARFEIPRGAGYVNWQKSWFEAEVNIEHPANTVTEGLGPGGLYSCIQRIRAVSGGTVLEEIDFSNRLVEDVVSLTLTEEEVSSVYSEAGDARSWLSDTNPDFEAAEAGRVQDSDIGSPLGVVGSVTAPAASPSNAFVQKLFGTTQSLRRTPRLRASLRLYGGLFQTEQWPALAAPVTIEIQFVRNPGTFPTTRAYVVTNPRATTLVVKKAMATQAGTGNVPFYTGQQIIIYVEPDGTPASGETFTRRIQSIANTGGGSTVTLTIPTLGGTYSSTTRCFIRPRVEGTITHYEILNPAINALLVPGDVNELEKAIKSGLEIELHSFRNYHRNLSSALQQQVSFELAEKRCTAAFFSLYQPRFIRGEADPAGEYQQATYGQHSGDSVSEYLIYVDGRAWPSQPVPAGSSANLSSVLHNVVLQRAFDAAPFPVQGEGGGKMVRALRPIELGYVGQFHDGHFIMGCPMAVGEDMETDMAGKILRLSITRTEDPTKGRGADVDCFVAHKQIFRVTTAGVQLVA